MLQSTIQRVSGVQVPRGGFFLNPDNAHLLIGRSQLLNQLRNEVLAFVSLASLSVLFLFITLQGLRPLILSLQLQQAGISAQGNVIGTRTFPASRVGQVTYFLEYRFTDASGEVFKAEELVNHQTFNRFTTGDSIPVKYLVENPAHSAVSSSAKDDIYMVSNLCVALTGIIGFLAVFGGAIWLGGHIWREEQFYRHAQLVKGHILTCHGKCESTPRSLKANTGANPPDGPFIINLSYTFHSPEGKTLKSSAMRQRNDLRGSRLPKFGYAVLVLYLNDQHYRLL